MPKIKSRVSFFGHFAPVWYNNTDTLYEKCLNIIWYLGKYNDVIIFDLAASGSYKGLNSYYFGDNFYDIDFECTIFKHG